MFSLLLWNGQNDRFFPNGNVNNYEMNRKKILPWILISLKWIRNWIEVNKKSGKKRNDLILTNWCVISVWLAVWRFWVGQFLNWKFLVCHQMRRCETIWNRCQCACVVAGYVLSPISVCCWLIDNLFDTLGSTNRQTARTHTHKELNYLQQQQCLAWVSCNEYWVTSLYFK